MSTINTLSSSSHPAPQSSARATVHSLASVAVPAAPYRNSGSWLPRLLAVLFIAGIVAAVLALAACAEPAPMSSGSSGSSTSAKEGMKAPTSAASAPASTAPK
jgi:hypothetical protein